MRVKKILGSKVQAVHNFYHKLVPALAAVRLRVNQQKCELYCRNGPAFWRTRRGYHRADRHAFRGVVRRLDALSEGISDMASGFPQ